MSIWYTSYFSAYSLSLCILSRQDIIYFDLRIARGSRIANASINLLIAMLQNK